MMDLFFKILLNVVFVVLNLEQISFRGTLEAKSRRISNLSLRDKAGWTRFFGLLAIFWLSLLKGLTKKGWYKWRVEFEVSKSLAFPHFYDLCLLSGCLTSILMEKAFPIAECV
jgi:hypothetical protein